MSLCQRSWLIVPYLRYNNIMHHKTVTNPSIPCIVRKKRDPWYGFCFIQRTITLPFFCTQFHIGNICFRLVGLFCVVTRGRQGLILHEQEGNVYERCQRSLFKCRSITWGLLCCVDKMTFDPSIVIDCDVKISSFEYFTYDNTCDPSICETGI